MNTDWNDLIQRHIAGLTTDEEARRLSTALKTDDALADLYVRHVELEVSLEAKAASAEATRELLTSSTVAPSSRWLSWRPLSAAAAGLVFGMLCTSIVFGFVMPRAVATASQLFTLVDGNFERNSGRLPSGFPASFGIWSGDYAEVVEGGSAQAMDGNRSLRFVQSERTSRLPNYGAATCDVYQLVSLSSLKSAAELNDATLELTVHFLDARKQKGETVRFIAKLYVFAGKPNAQLEEWRLTQNEALASGGASATSLGGAPQTWRNVTAKVLLPSQAEFALVHLATHKPDNKSASATTMFPSLFADNVRLTLKIQPPLPVRLVQR